MSLDSAESHYEVLSYSPETLFNCLFGKCDDIARANYDLASGDKLHYRYLQGYLGNEEITAQTLVIEHSYVDEDFLHDHAAYYAKCFQRYNRHCQRLHIFNNKFNEAEFHKLYEDISLINGDETQWNNMIRSYQNGYIGFIVIKPLSTCKIGRSCLRTYHGRISKDGALREYTTKHLYNANLFGMELRVETLAFQEQDHCIAACATSALWSVLNATGRFYHHALPSPVEITEIANELYSPSRKFPSEGLTSAQMSHVLHKFGIQPVVFNKVRVKSKFLAQVYSYSKCSLPIILNIALFNNNKEGTMEFQGYHSVVISGFAINSSKLQSNSLDNIQIEESEQGEYYAIIPNFAMKSDAIVKLYVHDDNIGPFSRIHVLDNEEGKEILTRVMDVKDNPIKKELLQDDFYVLKSGIYDEVDTTDIRVGIHLSTIVPTSYIMRITLAEVQDICYSFGTEYLKYISWRDRNYSIDYWDVYLTQLNDLRKEIITDTFYSTELRNDILLRSLPKYIWVARGIKNNNGQERRIIEFLIDATDINSDSCLLYLITCDRNLRDALECSIKNQFVELPNVKIFHKWRKNMKSIGIANDV